MSTSTRNGVLPAIPLKSRTPNGKTLRRGVVSARMAANL
nr:MAG TPA: hypothetical protein [Bacteriophage sp.]